MVHNAVELAPHSKAYFLGLVHYISPLTVPSDLVEILYSIDRSLSIRTASKADISVFFGSIRV